MVLVIILVVAWLVILGPSLIRRWSGIGDGVNSISHFHRQLRVLEHSRGTPIVPPAFRLRSITGPGTRDGSGAVGGSVAHGSTSRPVLAVVGAKYLPRPALAFLGADPLGAEYREGTPTAVAGSRHPQGSGHGSPPRTPLPINTDAHLVALRRRRDTLAVLVLAFTLTLAIGFIPGAGIAWVITAFSGVAMGAYVAMLVRLRAMEEERDRKLRYLAPAASRRARDGFDAEEALPFAESRYDQPARRAAAL